MKPLRVRANLLHGYSATDQWSPALDAILAYWALRDRLGEEEFALGTSGHRELVDADLPLERVTWGDDWWWACSSPVAETVQVFERHIHRRFDDQYERYMPEGVRRVETAAGPYKAYRNRHLVRLAPWIEWHVVGDRQEIERLLRRCVFVGSGLAKGWGEVASWDVTEDGDEQAAHLQRPLPRDYARANGVGGMVMRWGLRPPGRLPEHQRECVMP